MCQTNVHPTEASYHNHNLETNWKSFKKVSWEEANLGSNNNSLEKLKSLL